MSDTFNWFYQEDDDHLGNPAKIAFFDMPEHWDDTTDPHPNKTLLNKFVDFGNKFINSDPTAGTGFSVGTVSKATESTSLPASQQANNSGLLANVSKPAQQPATQSYTAPKIQKPASNPWPQSGSALSNTLESVGAGTVNTGPSTHDMFKTAAQGYMSASHDTVADTDKAASTFMGDIVYPPIKRTAKAMIKHRGDMAAHDSHTDYNLHYSQDPVGYSESVRKSWGDAGNAWATTDDANERRNIEKNAKNLELASDEFTSRVGHVTSKMALGINGLVTIGEEKMPTAVEVAHEVRRNRADREDIKKKMMTPSDIRKDTPENYASDMEDYLSQTLIGTHLVNLAKVRAYRGAPFMMSNAVDFIDKSFDVWADNIVEKGDHSYLSALKDTLSQNDITSNDVLINLMAKFMGGVNGDALLFFWGSMKATEKHEMMKQVKERQKSKMGMAESNK